MSLSAGTRLGPYEIVAPLGGGMDEVYRANPTDLRMRTAYVNEFFLVNMPEEGLLAQRRLLGIQSPDYRYYLATREVTKARSSIEESRASGTQPVLSADARLLALEGRHVEAQRLITDTLARAPRNRSYHHQTRYGSEG